MAAAPPEEESLQSRINKATNPLNKDTDWHNIKGFCDLLDNEPEGPQLATRLLAHKIQSPQEWEAMQALLVLESCMKNCGKRFHSEVGKFRFLNELIKVVSPKYLGIRAPEPVKMKVQEMMFSWTVTLPDETKIADAYQILKKQSIVNQDTILGDNNPFPSAPTKTKSTIFEDEEKSKTLSRLLNSTHPEDLSTANKLIKEMFQEDRKRNEKVSKRINTIREVKEGVSLLSELLEGHSKEGSSQSNQELIKDIYQRCEKMRPTLFTLASDTEDSDEALADILQANDNLTAVINLYKQQVKSEKVANDCENTPSHPGKSSSALLDLTGLSAPTRMAPFNPQPSNLETLTQNIGSSLLDDELMSLGLNIAESSESQNTFQSSAIPEFPAPSFSAARLCSSVVQTSQARPVAHKGMNELDLLGKTLLQQSLPPKNQQVKWGKLPPPSRASLRELQTKANCNSGPSAAPAASSVHEQLDILLFNPPSLLPSSSSCDISLADVTVPLELIHPSSLLPVTVYNKHSLRVLLTFARDCPPSRPDVLVVIISMLSSAPTPVTDIHFQAAVPKIMKVKLQPPSSTELPAFSPILPQRVITQILLLANPHKEKVCLRYKLTFIQGDNSYDESGDVDQFPPPNAWGNLM
ncbi:ADP-ribosylation factor-binding protein GGA1-like isoform X2 [Phycodurus eques]|uniref:ADP-ribosylation factor-binding protein GGA1-like isoform X2 n=1 Tax=Phycodurus eques TaxID=693459 RepID=UPI002ACE0109|nr:ADP-ribosylation factor-binding protein GGA1-like isoform X2 [Phycodurus eques]